MADLDGILENKDKDYGIGIPVQHQTFFLKGIDNCDWGIKDRMSRIFNVKSGHTVMLAFDHGYIMGPTSGLEPATSPSVSEAPSCIFSGTGLAVYACLSVLHTAKSTAVPPLRNM